ncbi:MAG TPA: ATP-binding cassette domain-containing protein [Saprospiraceae bacterium]|nr:ATP-binding cassette domain-containing protein [Saprospiraceae bacterium]
MQTTIEVKGLSKIYGSQRAVNGISFEARQGEILGFLGPNGAGKSTTLKMLSAYILPDEGDAQLCGYSIRNQPEEVKRRIGYLPEHNPLYKDMYVHEYLLCIARLYKLKQATQKVKSLIELTGLGPEQNKRIGAISKGYRQRVGLSQALIHDPEILILDEPTSGLDPNQLIDIRKLIKDFGKQKTLIFSSHIMQEVQALCDRVIIINKGNLIANQEIHELQNGLHSNQHYVVEFKQKILPSGYDHKSIKVKKLDEHHYRFSSSSSIHLGEEIFELAKQNNWIILEMVKEKNNLEDVFNSLTKPNQE